MAHEDGVMSHGAGREGRVEGTKGKYTIRPLTRDTDSQGLSKFIGG